MDFCRDKVWYFVDKRQELHFLRFFRTVKKARHFTQSTELKHFPFGTMVRQGWKPFKTERGRSNALSELLKTVTDSALVKMKESVTVQKVYNEADSENRYCAIKLVYDKPDE
jgi:arginyl-tRNA synthetase